MPMFMIACHMNNKKQVIGFRLIETESKEVRDYNYTSVKAVLEKGITIDGIKLENGELKGSNGAFERYTQLINGITIGKCPVVIIKQYPDDSYDVCNHLGQIAHMHESDIIQFASVEGIANGKIVNNNGNSYISSINGEYLKDKSFDDIAYADKLKLKMKLLGSSKYELSDDNLVSGVNKDLDTLLIGVGCLGVKESGFKNFEKLKSITLPSTCLTLGASAFMNCTSLEEINIPEGVTKIPKLCFSNCKNIKHIDLPNSIRVIEAGAFKGCVKLTTISTGPVKPEIGAVAIPVNTKIVVRR